MGAPTGFDYRATASGDVRISRGGRVVTVLRGSAAAAFLADVARADPQEEMARVTGNYRRGNERAARTHPRNAGR